MVKQQLTLNKNYIETQTTLPQINVNGKHLSRQSIASASFVTVAAT